MKTFNIIVAHTHRNRIVGVVELACEHETMVASPELAELGEGLAMHIAAMAPTFVSRDAVDEATRAREQVVGEGVGTRAHFDGFFRENCLLEQPFVLDMSCTVAAHLQSVARALGGEITVTRMWRHSAGSP